MDYQALERLHSLLSNVQSLTTEGLTELRALLDARDDVPPTSDDGVDQSPPVERPRSLRRKDDLLPSTKEYDVIITPNSLFDVRRQINVDLKGLDPLAAAARLVYAEKYDQYSREHPFVCGVEPGIYNRKYFLGGSKWSLQGAEAIWAVQGQPMHFAIVGIDPTRKPTLGGFYLKNNGSPLATTLMRNLELSNAPDWRACLQMEADDNAIGRFMIDDVAWRNPLEGGTSFGGAGTKWGAHLGDFIEELIVRNWHRSDTRVRAEEHSLYHKSGGESQYLDCEFGGSNRTGFQRTSYQEDLRPRGNHLVDNCQAINVGQDWDPHNGGSVMTWTGLPDGIIQIRKVTVDDARYGALALWPQGSQHHNENGTFFNTIILEDNIFDNYTTDEGEMQGDRYAGAIESANLVIFRGSNIFRGGGLLMQNSTSWGPVRAWAFESGSTVRASSVMAKTPDGSTKIIASGAKGELLSSEETKQAIETGARLQGATVEK